MSSIINNSTPVSDATTTGAVSAATATTAGALVILSDGSYRCSLCMIPFRTKYYFDKHFVFCKGFLHKPAKEHYAELESIDTELTTGQMSKLLRNLLYEFQKINKELGEVKVELGKLKKKQKTNIIKWLNSSLGPKPNAKTAKDWVRELSVSTFYIEKVLEDDLPSGMVAFLRDAIMDPNIISSGGAPISAFEQNTKTLYGYKTDKWEVMNRDDFVIVVRILSQKFSVSFSEWMDENEEDCSLRYRDRWEEVKLQYFKKICGGEMCEKTLTNNIYDKLSKLVYCSSHI